jgi:hypothetical protein
MKEKLEFSAALSLRGRFAKRAVIEMFFEFFEESRRADRSIVVAHQLANDRHN